MKRVVVLGGGYAGLAALRVLSRRLDTRTYDLALIDAAPYHTVKTRFHEMVVTRRKDPLICHPLGILARAAGARFVQAEVSGVDFRKRTVATARGALPYDILLLTLGGRTNTFGVPGVSRFCASLQTHEAALACRKRIEGLGLATKGSPVRRVIVCGAGIEGVEVAAMIRQHAEPDRLDILVLEKSDKILARSQCDDGQRAYIRNYFLHNGISLRTETAVAQVKRDGVRTAAGPFLPSDLVVWCSGVRRADVRGLGGSRPFVVNGFLQHEKHPEVFATGDVALVEGGGPDSNLLSAQRALFQARVMAENVVSRERGGPLRREAYRPAGELVALGDWDGVGVVGGVRVRGRTAALLKKANEARYLAELYRDVPGSMLRGVLPSAKRAPDGR